MRISDWSSDVCSSDLADEDHRIAVGRGMGQRGQAVEEARRRHREADTRLLRQESGNRRRVAGALLVPEREDPQALALHETAKVGYRTAGHALDSVDRKSVV